MPPQRPLRPGLSLRSRLTPAVTWILALSVGVFLVWIFGTDPVRVQLADWLVLTPGQLMAGKVWTLATTAFVNPNALTFLFNALMLVMFIPVLERDWGTRRFVIFVVASTLIANLTAALVGLALPPALPIAGLSAMIFASVVAFGTAYANQPVSFFGVVPMKGRTVAIGISAFLFISVLLNREWASGAGLLAAMAFAWLFAGGRFEPGTWMLRFRRNRIKKKLSVMQGGETGRPPKKQDWLN